MEATYYKGHADRIDYTPTAATDAGAVVLLPDGRAGVVATDLAANELGAVYVSGQFKVTKTTSKVFTDDDAAYWDFSDNTILDDDDTIAAEDFYLGVPLLSAAAGGGVANTDFVVVDLNVKGPAHPDSGS